MGIARIKEINYYEFLIALRNARDNGMRIEKTSETEWKDYVRSNDIKEVSFMSVANKKYENMKQVIIKSDDEWEGFYAYSDDDEAVIKWTIEK